MLRLFHTGNCKRGDILRHELATSNHSTPFFQPFRRFIEYLRSCASKTSSPGLWHLYDWIPLPVPTATRQMTHLCITFPFFGTWECQLPPVSLYRIQTLCGVRAHYLSYSRSYLLVLPLSCLDLLFKSPIISYMRAVSHPFVINQGDSEK